jgi:hypothetical protein
MWNTVAQNSSLILGLAISAYTIYLFIETRVTRRRQRYALLRNLQMQSEYFIALAGALSKRAQQVVELYVVNHAGESFPQPGAEKDSLPDEAEKETRWIVSRAEHLLTYQITIDIEKIGSILNRRQMESLLDFMHSHLVYTQVIATRTVDLKAFPKRKGVLWRLAAVAAINIEEVNKQLNALRVSLGITENRSPAVK